MFKKNYKKIFKKSNKEKKMQKCVETLYAFLHKLAKKKFFIQIMKPLYVWAYSRLKQYADDASAFWSK